MIILLDNYDSFTYNILHYCNELDYNVKVLKNDKMSIKQITKLNPTHIIISPGPATYKESGISLDIVKNFYKKIPILGICLGHQIIAHYFKANIIKSKNIMHGKTSKIIQVKDSKIFKKIPKKFTATRYHSYVVDKNLKKSNLQITSYSDDGEIMSIELKNYPVFGVQFHPESIMSEFGHQLLKNFLKL